MFDYGVTFLLFGLLLTNKIIFKKSTPTVWLGCVYSKNVYKTLLLSVDAGRGVTV